MRSLGRLWKTLDRRFLFLVLSLHIMLLLLLLLLLLPLLLTVIIMPAEAESIQLGHPLLGYNPNAGLIVRVVSL